MVRVFTCLLTLALSAPTTGAQAPSAPGGGTAIGEFLLSLKARDGSGIPNVPVVVQEPGGTVQLAGTTDASGELLLSDLSFLNETAARAGILYGLVDSDATAPEPPPREGDAEFGDLAAAFRSISYSASPGSAPVAYEMESGLLIPVAILNFDEGFDACERDDTASEFDVSEFFCELSIPIPEPSYLPLFGQNSLSDYSQRATLTCFPIGALAEVGGRRAPTERLRIDPETTERAPNVAELFGAPTRPMPCLWDTGDPAIPQPGIFATHGYNLDFEEGSWGVRGIYPLPLGAPVGVAGGIDYFPEDEFNSLTVLGVDLTYHVGMDLLGRGTAYGGLGPRYYRSSFDNGSASSSSGEFGTGLVLGATVPVGPVAIYGDIGADRVFNAWSGYTRFGVGIQFGTDE